MGNKYDPITLFLGTYNYDDWFKNEKSTDTTRIIDKQESTNTTRKSDKEKSVDLSDILPLEGDEEVKEGKGSEVLTPNKLLSRIPILLAQIKSANNSHKLKIEIRQILYLLYQQNKITRKVYNNLIKPL